MLITKCVGNAIQMSRLFLGDEYSLLACAFNTIKGYI
jgi:hypothetical protein